MGRTAGEVLPVGRSTPVHPEAIWRLGAARILSAALNTSLNTALRISALIGVEANPSTPATDKPAAGVQPHLVFDNISRQYPSPTGTVHALREVSFTVARGEIFGIIGRSGAGKSTLLRSINALEIPDTGSVAINGLKVGSLDEDALVKLRRRVGMIFQHFNLLSAKTVRDNVGLPLRVAGVARSRSVHASMPCSIWS